MTGPNTVLGHGLAAAVDAAVRHPLGLVPLDVVRDRSQYGRHVAAAESLMDVNG